jgi:hypothetical protein
MSGFALGWLDLREKADREARDPALARQAQQWLAAGSETAVVDAIVVDLGAGSGSTLRALAGLHADAAAGACNLVWRLVDHDGVLLDEALRRHGKTCLIEDYQLDLAVIDELPLGGARLVTASALFDLASAAFAAQLIARIAGYRDGRFTGLYAALNYDGSTAWTPQHPLDAAVLAAFNADQRRDKGMGPALGPDATTFLQAELSAAGYTVLLADSPWRLGPIDQALVRELVRGIAAAVISGHGLDAEQVQDWEQFRLAHAMEGTCTVGHQDLLALPTGIG